MSQETLQKPPNMFPEHLEYLNDLRESNITNMWGAAPFLKRTYPSLSIEEARDILQYWMKTFE